MLAKCANWLQKLSASVANAGLRCHKNDLKLAGFRKNIPDVKLIDDILAEKAFFLPVIMKPWKILESIPFVLDLSGNSSLWVDLVADFDFLFQISCGFSEPDGNLSCWRGISFEVRIPDQVVDEGTFSRARFTHKKHWTQMMRYELEVLYDFVDRKLNLEMFVEHVFLFWYVLDFDNLFIVVTRDSYQVKN